MLPRVLNILRWFLHRPGRQDVGGRCLNLASQWNYFCWLLTDKDIKWLWRDVHRVEQFKWKNTTEMAEKSVRDLFQIPAVIVVFQRISATFRWGFNYNYYIYTIYKSDCNMGGRNVSKGTNCAYLSGWKPAHGFPKTKMKLRNKQKGKMTMTGKNLETEINWMGVFGAKKIKQQVVNNLARFNKNWKKKKTSRWYNLCSTKMHLRDWTSTNTLRPRSVSLCSFEPRSLFVDSVVSKLQDFQKGHKFVLRQSNTVLNCLFLLFTQNGIRHKFTVNKF